VLDILKQRQAAIGDLCQRYRVRTLEIFGSAADGTFDPDGSDLDFLVDFLPMKPAEHSRAYFGLWFALRDLFGREVDLVEAHAVTNPYFQKQIDKQREVVYAARDRQVPA
jgi:uncharacterized protein